jgi:tRNA(Ile)-lysidine synthase TilS/MesJ
MEQNNYGINFIRPLINTPRNEIEKIMKNYGYFLDPTRNYNFQRNLVRKIHKDMELAGITIRNIHITIKESEKSMDLIGIN